MNILVTGSAGFIGSHLVTQLKARGHHVLPIDKRTGTSTTDRYALPWAINRGQPDAIVHLGASCSTSRSLTNPGADFHDNAIGTFNVAEAARRAGGIPVIYTSTVKVHPGADGKIAPLGLSKRVGEDYLRLYGDLYDVPSVILRPSTVYGPGQDGSPEAGWVTWFLRAFLDRKPITIHGDGSQSRDILHINDMTTLLVDICEYFPRYHRAEPYDVGGGPRNEVTLRGLLAHLGHTDVVHDERLPGDLQQVVTDNTDISGAFGWVPSVSWQDGVQATLEWMRRHP
ncbi:NAD-dependent epimerase/dehydratase family protein [Streptomyces cacaoi]